MGWLSIFSIPNSKDLAFSYARFGEVEKLEKLLAAGLSPNSVCSATQFSLLAVAVCGGYIAAAACIAYYKANPNQTFIATNSANERFQQTALTYLLFPLSNYNRSLIKFLMTYHVEFSYIEHLLKANLENPLLTELRQYYQERDILFILEIEANNLFQHQQYVSAIEKFSEAMDLLKIFIEEEIIKLEIQKKEKVDKKNLTHEKIIYYYKHRIENYQEKVEECRSLLLQNNEEFSEESILIKKSK
jgi:hypothetical protein